MPEHWLVSASARRSAGQTLHVGVVVVVAELRVVVDVVVEEA